MYMRNVERNINVTIGIIMYKPKKYYLTDEIRFLEVRCECMKEHSSSFASFFFF